MHVLVRVKVFVFVRVMGEDEGALETGRAGTELEAELIVTVEDSVLVRVDTEVKVEAEALEVVVQVVELELGVTTTTVLVEAAALGVMTLELWVRVQGQLVMVRVVASVIVYVTPLWVS